MGFNPLTGKDETEDLLVQQGYENPVPEAVTPTPDVDGFLNTIAQIESSGGKDFNHSTMQSGIHAGEAAMGRFGLMPNTLREIAVRAKREGKLNDQMKSAIDIEDSQKLKELIESNPEIERMFAEQLAQRVLKKFPDSEQAAYSWNQGHNLTPEAVQKRDYKNSDYVKKFNNLRNKLASK